MQRFERKCLSRPQKPLNFGLTTMEIEFYSQYGKNKPTSTKETFRKPSLTEPDNAMSIPEIIARFTRGQGIPVQQYQWQTGSAPEDGFYPEDETPEKVLGIQLDPEPESEPTPPPADAGADA